MSADAETSLSVETADGDLPAVAGEYPPKFQFTVATDATRPISKKTLHLSDECQNVKPRPTREIAAAAVYDDQNVCKTCRGTTERGETEPDVPTLEDAPEPDTGRSEVPWR
mgnify:CR=1 FL=1